MSKIYKELKKLDIENQIIKNGGTCLSREFSIEDSQVVEKHLKMFNILNYQENVNQSYSVGRSYICQNG